MKKDVFFFLKKKEEHVLCNDKRRKRRGKGSRKIRNKVEEENNTGNKIHLRTLRLTRRTPPADSAMYIEQSGDAGSGTAARILDFISMGSPCLLPALSAFLARCAWDALSGC